MVINLLNAELNPICHLLALLSHHIFHVSGVRVKRKEVSKVQHIATPANEISKVRTILHLQVLMLLKRMLLARLGRTVFVNVSNVSKERR